MVAALAIINKLTIKQDSNPNPWATVFAHKMTDPHAEERYQAEQEARATFAQVDLTLLPPSSVATSTPSNDQLVTLSASLTAWLAPLASLHITEVRALPKREQ